MSTAPLLQTKSRRRSYDRLQVARLCESEWDLGRPSVAETAAWPYLAVSTLAGDVTLAHGGRVLEFAEGDVCVIRNDAAVSVTATAGVDVLVMRLPAGSADAHGAVLAAAEGLIWTSRNGTASLVAHLLRGLADQLEDYTPGNPGRLVEHVVGMLALMCADVAGQESGGRPALLAKAQEYIEAHLGEVDLSPDRIALAQNVSTRTLHRLFEREGLTISGWIRARRLEHCRRDLVDRHIDITSVSRVGARWGLWDAAHFSRLFKAAYGASPRAYRAAHIVHDCGDDCALEAAGRAIAAV